MAKDRLLLSSCCGCFIYYAGSGSEYSTKCGAHCGSQRQLFSKRERISSNPRVLAPITSCFVCAQRNSIQQTLHLLDPSKRCVVPYGLCNKHVVPKHITATIFDERTLLLYFQQQQARQVPKKTRLLKK